MAERPETNLIKLYNKETGEVTEHRPIDVSEILAQKDCLYQLEPLDKEDDEDDEDESTPIEEMTKAQLLVKATELKIDGAGSMNKADLLEAVQDALADPKRGN